MGASVQSSRKIGGKKVKKGGGRKPGMDLPGLKEVRTERDLTVKALAAMSKVHPNTIVRLENVRGGADHRTAYRIARALEVPLQTLRQSSWMDE